MASVNEDWISQARVAIRQGPVDFFEVNATKYWFDLLTCTLIAYVSAGIYLSSPLFSWQQFIAFPFAVFWLYRANSMVHEVSHLNKSQLPSFKIVEC